MSVRSKFAAALALAAGFATGSALAIDPFFPTFGNNGIDVLHYRLELYVEPEDGELTAGALLKIKAQRNLSRFTLDLAGLEVDEVVIDGREAGFSQARGKLIVTPRSAIDRGETFFLAVAYHGRPRPIPDPTPDSGYELGWFNYRSASYVVSEPVGASTFYPANDEPTDKATFAIAVTVPDDYTAAANGVLVDTDELLGRKRFVWEMDEPMTTWLATVHVNRFRLDFSRAPDGTPIRVYATAATPAADVRSYALAGDMIPFFERLIGQYPFEGYGSVVVDDPLLDYALETQAMSTFPLGTADEATVAHELAHQWFGNSVSVAKWADLWLAEGTSTYFEVLWPNRDEPAAFDAEMREIYDYVADNEIGPAVVEAPEEMFTDRTYLRGAAALYALQLEVGKATFFRILRRFVSDFSGKNATSADFIRAAVEVSGDDSVRRLLRAWLYEQPVPPLPGRPASAKRGPAERPDIVGLRCGRGAHRGAPATC